jgi:formylglycine-generating enzyme required for sulfatase activity
MLTGAAQLNYKIGRHRSRLYPMGIVAPNASHRVMRGGSWRTRAEDCRAADRGRIDPSSRLNANGVRVCFRLD